MELLTPAGGVEQLRYALHFGADAVYLAGERFGLRERAENFHGVDLPFAISLAHEHGKKVYIAANSLIHQEDLPEFRSFIETIGEIGADAAIVSDLSAIELLREFAPNVAIHISTQASVVNARTARLYHSLGAKRIVLARELTLQEISAIRDAVPDDLELEAFVHGAMCIAYSGRCLISNYLVGRDANRGGCTQPCRWRWSLQEETRPGEFFPIEEDGSHSFVLSSADLNMLEHIDDLRRAGVDSLKVEGRVKGAYYVGVVTNAYRRVIDGEPAERYLSELDTVSHRPYHTGFFYGTPAQSYEGREYTQTCDFVGGVSACTPDGNGSYRISFLLRNRIFRDDTLEVLSPGKDVLRIRCRDLLDEDGLPCSIADHNAHRYSFESDIPLEPLDILRKRRTNADVQAGR
ncbi:MAG: U32 family peptidase [Coriobacteriia bacterium]|nr:U32 family peptidase [Coriobacteriia bacterium]